MNIVKCDLRKFYTEKENKNIIVFGAGIEISKFFNNTYLDNRILFFVDNNKYLTKKRILGIEYDVYTVSKLKELQDTNYIILIGSCKFETEMLQQLEELNINNSIYLLSDIKNCTEYYCIKFFKNNLIKKDNEREQIEEKLKYLLDNDDKKLLCVPKFSMHITTRCTLACKHCRALMPYIPEKKDVPLQSLLNDIQIVTKNIDWIPLIELIGGETLLYPHLAEALEKLIECDNVYKIRVTTNGTVIPDEKTLKVLKHEKIMVMISDYGLLEKMAKVVKIFEKNNVNFEIEKYSIWNDCGFGEYNNSTINEMKKQYKICKSFDAGPRQCVMVDEGKMYVCPRSARVSRMGIELPQDYKTISLSDTKETLREKINYLAELEYAQACNHCLMGKQTLAEVKPAIQLGREMETSKYTIVDREEYNKLLRLAKK